jgi:hypothetical protein
MDETTLKPTEPTLGAASASPDARMTERWQALVDVLYLSQVVWLYVFSAIYPVMGLFYGILFLAGGISPKAKRIGKVCLILGVINTALVILGLVMLLVLGLAGALAGIGQD